MLNSAEHEICPANESKITNNANSFLLNIAEHVDFSADKYENANFYIILIYLLAEKISCSAELCMKKVL